MSAAPRTPTGNAERRWPFGLRASVVGLEIALVVGLGLWWALSPSLRESCDLWVLFVYSLPSEFVIAVVPHEPAVIFFGQHHAPWVVAAVATVGTLLVEALNYWACRFFLDLGPMRRAQRTRLARRLVDLFSRAPFLTLIIAGTAPIPYYPFRFVVAMSRYPLKLYLLSLLITRGSRFYLLAWLGAAVQIPDSVLVGIFVFFTALVVVPLLAKR